jgi:hypothetical protein
MTELFHRGYNPRTLPPEFTTWSDFVVIEGDSLRLAFECDEQLRRGRGGPHDRRGVCSCRTVTGLRFMTEAGRRVVCRA